MACTQERTLGCLSGWDGSRKGGRSSLWYLGSPRQGGYGGWAHACPKALVELVTVLVCVPPDSFQSWPCRLPSRAKSEHLCGFSSLSPTICPTLGQAAYLTPWLHLWRSPGPCSESLGSRTCGVPDTLAAAVVVSWALQ